MKLEFYEESNMILFLNNLYLSEIDFKDKDALETYFKSLFLKLHEFYEIEVNGYYHIDIYMDPFYGAIIELEKEELDYLDYDDDQVDMRICLHKTTILYELKEYMELDKSIYDIIWYHKKWYVKLKEKISSIHLGKLLEYSKMHYHEETERILKNGTLIQEVQS